MLKDIIKECMNTLQFFVALSFVDAGESFLIPLSSLNTAFEKQTVLRRRNGESILTADEVYSHYHQWLGLKVQHEEWHIFLSYRWNHLDSPFVSALYDYFSLYKLEGDLPVDVFLDTECLQNGKMFQREFSSALKNSALVILTISEETLKRMVMHKATEIDNVLVEWLCTVEYFESSRSRVSRVCPIFFGHRDGAFGISSNLFHSDVCLKMPSVVPTASIAKAKELLLENGIAPRSAIDNFTVMGLFQHMKSYLCLFAWDTARFLTPEVIVSECVVDALVMLKNVSEELKSKNISLNSKSISSGTPNSAANISCNDTLSYCQQSWKMLLDPNSLAHNNQQELKVYLERLGVCNAKDMAYFNDLEEEDKQKIRGFLKKIPFKKLLNVDSIDDDFMSFNFDNAWEVLCDQNSVADKNQEALHIFLMNLGAYEAKDLAYLDEEDRAHIQTFLRKMAVIKFTKNMKVK